ncbi:hypothetical protein EV177_009902, partial [Coemansia sp. RSA 1804]
NIWLRLIGKLATYMHTGKLASESRIQQQQQQQQQQQVVTTDSQDSEGSSTRNIHLPVLGEMAEESIKNCLLVLDSMGIFGDVNSNPDHEKPNALWNRTWEKLDKVDPRLKSRVFPETKSSSDETASLSLVADEKPAADAGPDEVPDI